MAGRTARLPSFQPRPQAAVLRVTLAEDGSFALLFPPDPTTLGMVRELDGAHFDAARRWWSVPPTKDNARTVRWIAAELGFVTEGIAAREAARLLGEGEKPRLAPPPVRAQLKQTLFWFQRKDVHYALEKERCFIADEMGLGKTITAVAAWEEGHTYPAVVVCPASVKLNWRRQARTWLPDTRRVLLVDGEDSLANADFYDIAVVTYETLSKTTEIITDGRKHKIFPVVLALRRAFPDLLNVTLDEGHYIKNQDTLRTKACMALGHGVRFLFCLGGTPIMNRPVELVQQLRFLDRLKTFGGYWSFVKRYCAANKTRFGWDVSGASNLVKLNEKLRATCYIRHTKAEVFPDLKKVAYPVFLPITNRAEYDRAEMGHERFVDSEDGQRSPAEAMVRRGKLKRLAAKGKLGPALEWAENLVTSTGKKLLVFGWHEEIVDAVAAHFGEAALSIKGTTTPLQRQLLVDRFGEDESVRVLAGNMRAMGTGTDGLQKACNTLAFFEFAETSVEHEQCEDRLTRVGQTEPVVAWYLIAEGTVDEDQLQFIGNKQSTVHTATQGTSVTTEENKTVLAELVRRRPTKEVPQ